MNLNETTATILLGCRLAKDFEENLQNMANLQPDYLWRNCDEIIRVFSNVKERLSMSYPQMGFGIIEDTSQRDIQTAAAAPIDLLQEHFFGGKVDQLSVHGFVDQQQQEMSFETGGESEVGRWLREQAVVSQATSSRLSAGGRASSSSPRHRRRKNEGGRIRIIVAAPRVGNTEIPPEDGYTWRKYGQKDILKSTFPRSYFRCTHQKLYNCAAKKQVQRLDNDPSSFEVIYRGKHICHLSSTAPSVPPPPPPPPPSSSTSTELRQDIIHHLPPPLYYTTAGTDITHSLSMGIMNSSSSSGQITTSIDFSMPMGGGASGNSGGGGGVEDQLLEFMTDAMFNSGSSSNNSMDLIFPSFENKPGSGERKN